MISITKLAINLTSPLPELDSFNRYLFIGPHPDDIEIGAGATAAKLAENGKTVAFLCCIDGRYGSAAVPPEELIPIRQAEAKASAAALGVSDIRFLPFCDGGFYDKHELTSAIAKVVGEFNPDIIFCPDPQVKSECHPDHLNVGKAASGIAYFAPYEGIMQRHGAASAPVKAIAYYMTVSPNRYVKTSKKLLDRQLSAIFDCHKSQFPEGSSEGKAIALYLKLRSLDFGLRSFCLHSEGFRMLDTLRMHCLPEAGK